MVYHAQIAQVDVNQWGKFNPNKETILTWLEIILILTILSYEKCIDWGLCQCMSVSKEVEFVRYDDNIPATPLTCFNHMHN